MFKHLTVFCLAFAINVGAIEKKVEFRQETQQILILDTAVDETDIDLPPLDNYNPDQRYFYNKKIILTNQGQSPLKNFRFTVNKKCFGGVDELKKSFGVATDSELFLRFYKWWQESRVISPLPGFFPYNPFFVLSFLGCTRDSGHDAHILTMIASCLGIPYRQVDIHNHSVNEFYFDDKWHLIDSFRGLIYLNLDNTTIADFEELIDDPFLILRTRSPKQIQENPIADAWHRLSQFEIMNPQEYPKKIFNRDKMATFSDLGFDLYPEEQLIFHYDTSPELASDDDREDSSAWKLAIAQIEAKVLPQKRSKNGTFVYRSAYPIYRIANPSSQTVILLDFDNVAINPGEYFDISEHPVFEVHIAASESNSLEVFCYGARLSFPALRKGENILEITTTTVPESLEAVFVLNSDLEEETPCEIKIANIQPVFDYIKPYFVLNPERYDCEKVWWQISATSDFAFVISNFNTIQSFESIITLSDLDETFLNNGQQYFFRIKGCCDNFWGKWSEPFAFVSNKPEPITDAYFEKIEKNGFKIFWESQNPPETTFLIFGSNSLDFIPLVNPTSHVDSLLGSQVISMKEESHLIAETAEACFAIDGRFAYYRVIAKCQGQLSQPSPLIHFYDRSLHHYRDVLQLDKQASNEESRVARRLPFPPAYEWMQDNAWKQVAKSYHVNSKHAKYIKNPYVSDEVWQEVEPYFLPENHPAKSALDRIFKKSRASESKNTMRRAGFFVLKHPQNCMIIAKHPKLKGYLVKAYPDSTPTSEWIWWLQRIRGSRTIQSSLDRHGYNHIMKVPKKWIYPLPPEPSPSNSEGITRKNFILIVEDMKLISQKKNTNAFRRKINREILDALYIVLTENLLIDSVFKDNIPFSKDGKIAFIDTEHVNNRSQPIPLHRISKYLNPVMRSYWESLISK
jgi:hypothetical protein